MRKELNLIKNIKSINKKESCTQNNNLVIGKYYVLYHENMWNRIIIDDINVDNSVFCFSIDTGKLIKAKQSQIYPLESKFFNIPGQVI